MPPVILNEVIEVEYHQLSNVLQQVFSVVKPVETAVQCIAIFLLEQCFEFLYGDSVGPTTHNWLYFPPPQQLWHANL